MSQLLFGIVFSEMVLILVLLFRTPLRKLLMMGLNQLKQGRGPLVVRTVAATVMVVFASVIYNAMSVQRRLSESSVINPTDEVLMVNRLLEASLMGFSLFLAIMIDRLHYYVRELQQLRNRLEATKKMTREGDYVSMESIERERPSFSHQMKQKEAKPTLAPKSD